MFTNNNVQSRLMAIFPALLIIALYVLPNVAFGACGAPGGC